MKYGNVLAAGLLVAMTGMGQAATLSFLGAVDPAPAGPTKTYVSTTVRGALTCVACMGLNSDLAGNVGAPALPTPANATGFSGTNFSDLFTIANDGDATELAFINTVMTKLGLPTFASMTKKAGTGGNMTFSSAAKYIFIKIGSDPNVTMIENTGNVSQEYSWLGGTGGGLSHYAEVGQVSQVPLPAAGWLMIAGLGGLASLRRNRKAV